MSSRAEDFWVIRTPGQEYRVTEHVAMKVLAWYRAAKDQNVSDYIEIRDLYDSRICITVNSVMVVYETTATQRDEEGEHLDFLNKQRHQSFD